MLADPTTNAQIPLAGTVLAYATAIVFLTTGGHYDLIALWASSFELLPVGFGAVELNISAVGEFMSALFLLAMGIVGVCVLVIFLADMEALDAVGGHRANAARALGISERTLRYRLASFREAGIAVGGSR